MRAKPYIVVATSSSCWVRARRAGRAIGRRPRRTAGSSPAADVLLLDTDAAPVAMSPSSGSILSGEAGAVAGPDGARLYSATMDGDDTVLVVRDATTGDQVSTTTVPGELDVRVASDSGNAVALMAPLPEGVDAWTPVPRARTTIVVADPQARAPLHGPPARQLRARGVLRRGLAAVPDPVPPGGGAGRLSRDRLDLADGDVDEVHGRFKTRRSGCRGSGRQVFDRTTSQLYTLYTTEPRDGTQDYGGWSYGGREETFVHVLNLQRGWAYCAGLPRRFWGSPRPRSDRALAGRIGALHRGLDARRGGRHEHADVARSNGWRRWTCRRSAGCVRRCR